MKSYRTPIKNSNKPEFIGQLIDVVEDFLTARIKELAAEDDEPIIVGRDYDVLHDSFEELLKNWKLIRDEKQPDMDFYIGSDSASGIYAKTKEEFFSYLSDMIEEAKEKGEKHFDVSVMDNVID